MESYSIERFVLTSLFNIMFVRFIHIVLCKFSLLFALLNALVFQCMNIPTIFVHSAVVIQLVDIWPVSRFGLSRIMMLGAFFHLSSSVHMYLFLRSISRETCWIIGYVNLLKQIQSVFQNAQNQNSLCKFQLLHFLINMWYYFCHCKIFASMVNIYAVVLRCGFLNL